MSESKEEVTTRDKIKIVLTKYSKAGASQVITRESLYAVLKDLKLDDDPEDTKENVEVCMTRT